MKENGEYSPQDFFEDVVEHKSFQRALAQIRRGVESRNHNTGDATHKKRLSTAVNNMNMAATFYSDPEITSGKIAKAYGYANNGTVNTKIKNGETLMHRHLPPHIQRNIPSTEEIREMKIRSQKRQKT